MSVRSNGEMGKGFCPNFLQHILENIERRSWNDASRELQEILEGAPYDEDEERLAILFGDEPWGRLPKLTSLA